MKSSTRVLYNTFALYCKVIISTLATLYLTRVVLENLGVEDFGLYSLIAGVISLLSFFNVSLMSSTQRFMSVSMGAKDFTEVRKIFSSSMILHLFLGLSIFITTEILGLFIFDGFLNIPIDRVNIAKVVYHIVAVSMFITIIGSPYNAAINAYEDIWFFAITDIISALLKLGIIIGFMMHLLDPLLLYALWMLIVTFINTIIKCIWCLMKYKKTCEVSLSVRDKMPIIKKLSSFVGWNTFGSIAVLGRNQGVSVVLNIFFSTSINAVYGIANQVNSQLVYFSHMITTSMTPRIMKCKGEENISKLLSLSVLTSKVTYFLSAIFSIPLILEIDFVLKLWLGNVPEFTSQYCIATILLFMVMQLYPGLNRAIQADGRIKDYKIWTSVLILLPIIIGAVLFKLGLSHFTIMYLMILAQISVMILTIHMCKVLLGLDTKLYYVFVLKATFVSIISYILCFFIKNMMFPKSNIIELLVVSFISVIILSILFYYVILDKNEKNIFINLIKKVKK